MNASLYYFKGFRLRDKDVFPNLSRWFDALETRATYRGTQSDFHTHCHDLPPQMGGCYEPPVRSEEQVRCREHVDEGPWSTLPDAKFDAPKDARIMAALRVMRHRKSIVGVNPVEQKEAVDEALRCVLTVLLTDNVPSSVPPDADVSMRYVRDRINVPRDMPIWSARYLRQACEDVARRCGDRSSITLGVRDRRDQDPRPFGHGGRGDEYDEKRATETEGWLLECCDAGSK